MDFRVIVAQVAGAALTSGCASEPLPYCERYQYQVAEDAQGEQFIVLDLENVRRLTAVINGLAAGTCRAYPPKSAGAPT